jgi:hypothetical protein
MHKLKVVPRVTVRGMRVPKSIGDVKDFPFQYAWPARYRSLSLLTSHTAFTSTMAEAPLPPGSVLKSLPSGCKIVLPTNNDISL